MIEGESDNIHITHHTHTHTHIPYNHTNSICKQAKNTIEMSMKTECDRITMISKPSPEAYGEKIRRPFAHPIRLTQDL